MFLVKSEITLAQRLSQYPSLKNRIELLINIIEDRAGDWQKANEAEMRVIEELRQMGQARQDFSRKLKWDPSDFSGEKLSWRLLPSAARVRPASAAAHNSPSVRCAPLAYANDLTPCRMALHFDYASAAAPTSSKRPAPTATRGSSYTAPLALRFLYSFNEALHCWSEHKIEQASKDFNKDHSTAVKSVKKTLVAHHLRRDSGL